MFETIQKLNISNRLLSQCDLLKYVKRLKIKNFIGIYMRDILSPNYSVIEIENGIKNLDSIKKNLESIGHVGLKIINATILIPLLVFQNFIKCENFYSTYQIQNFDEVICGHWCLIVLFGLAVLKNIFILFFMNYFFSIMSVNIFGEEPATTRTSSYRV